MKEETNKQQTAVDWLIEELENKGDAWENVSIRRLQISIDVSEYLDLKRKAKKMEKEQIEDAYDYGFADGFDDGKYDDEPQYGNAEQYYEEMHGGDE